MKVKLQGSCKVRHVVVCATVGNSRLMSHQYGTTTLRIHNSTNWRGHDDGGCRDEEHKDPMDVLVHRHCPTWLGSGEMEEGGLQFLHDLDGDDYSTRQSASCGFEILEGARSARGLHENVGIRDSHIKEKNIYIYKIFCSLICSGSTHVIDLHDPLLPWTGCTALWAWYFQATPISLLFVNGAMTWRLTVHITITTFSPSRHLLTPFQPGQLPTLFCKIVSCFMSTSIHNNYEVM